MKLLVVDIQKGITDERLFGFGEFINRVTKIMEAARANNVEVIHFQHDDGPGTGFSVGDDAFVIAPQASPLEQEKVFVKTINSCFGNKDFAEYMRESGEKNLMIIGLQTNFCMDATIKSAFERGYKIFVPAGTNSTFDNAYMDGETTCKYYNEMMWPNRFAECISVEEAIGLLEAAE